MSGGILLLPVLNKLKELFRATLFKQAHEGGLDGLHLGAGDLGDLAIAVNERTRDLLELEVTSDIGVDEDVGQFTRRDDELGDQVDRVVPVASQLGGGLGIAEFAIQLKQSQL